MAVPVAKYGLTFLCLLIPACLLQYPLNVEIGRYTLLTGETHLPAASSGCAARFGVVLWLLMTLSFLWFGAFASAGGTALAALTGFPAAGRRGAQTLFWGYAPSRSSWWRCCSAAWSTALIERFMKAVALVTVVGLLWACLAARRATRGAARLPARRSSGRLARCLGLGRRPTPPSCSPRSPSPASAGSGSCSTRTGCGRRGAAWRRTGPHHRACGRQPEPVRRPAGSPRRPTEDRRGGAAGAATSRSTSLVGILGNLATTADDLPARLGAALPAGAAPAGVRARRRAEHVLRGELGADRAACSSWSSRRRSSPIPGSRPPTA